MLGACGTAGPGGSANPEGPVIPPVTPVLGINEVMSQNEGAWVDASGETNDWIEVVNPTDESLDVRAYWIEDGSGRRTRLQGPALAPGEKRLLWADGDDSGAVGHLPFKLSSAGDTLRITDELERVSAEVEVPALAANEVLARFPDASGSFIVCRYASPARDNGASCAPPDPPALLDDVTFEPAPLGQGFPPAPAGLGLSELSLRPAVGGNAFVELYNGGNTPLELDAFALRIATHAPHLPWPSAAQGLEVPLPPGARLAPGGREVVELASGDLAELELDPNFEGVVTLFSRNTGEKVDRVDFMSWPRGSALMQRPGTTLYRYCTNATPGTEGECDPLASRPVGDRLRYLRTPGDYAALAQGGDEVGIQSVKFVVDLNAPGLVHLLGSARWPLHYTFVRELVYREPVLDRCDPAQNSEFYQGWSEFSATEYFRVEGRRFLLGTL